MTKSIGHRVLIAAVAIAMIALTAAALVFLGSRIGDSKGQRTLVQRSSRNERSHGPAAAAEASAVQKLPRCADSGERAVFDSEHGVEAINTTVDEAQQHMTYLPLPSELPTWVQCQVVSVIWSKETPLGDSLTLDLYQDGPGASTPALTFRFIAHSLAPAGGGDSLEPCCGREGWYRDVRASGSGPEGEAHGTRIVWIDSQERYFELVGPFDLEEAVKIADSVRAVN